MAKQTQAEIMELIKTHVKQGHHVTVHYNHPLAGPDSDMIVECVTCLNKTKAIRPQLPISMNAERHDYIIEDPIRPGGD